MQGLLYSHVSIYLFYFNRFTFLKNREKSLNCDTTFLLHTSFLACTSKTSTELCVINVLRLTKRRYVLPVCGNGTVLLDPLLPTLAAWFTDEYRDGKRSFQATWWKTTFSNILYNNLYLFYNRANSILFECRMDFFFFI